MSVYVKRLRTHSISSHLISLQMRLAKAEKRFSQCSLLQRSLQEMQTIQEALPSVREIEEEIRSVS